MISRIKIMSDIDIAERRKPQDGRLSVTHQGRKIDLRVATLPTVWGEKVVMRILDNATATLDLEDLGLSDDNSSCAIEKSFTKPYGMILVTGPTGSGKSTTLYATLNQIARPEINVITVEDPVEYRIPGINQVQVNPKAGLTFAAALRSILRADPDVVLVGEIRDGETAQIAIEAALTGHLVLVHPSHQRCAERDHSTDRDGHRAVPGGLRRRLRRRPAPGAPPVHPVPARNESFDVAELAGQIRDAIVEARRSSCRCPSGARIAHKRAIGVAWRSTRSWWSTRRSSGSPWRGHRRRRSRSVAVAKAWRRSDGRLGEGPSGADVARRVAEGGEVMAAM